MFCDKSSRGRWVQCITRWQGHQNVQSGDDLADKAAAKAYRRNAEKVAEKEVAAAAKLTRAAKLAAEVRVPIDGEEYIAEFVGEAEDFLASHKTLNEKIMRAASKGVVAKRSKTGVVASEKPEYDYKIKILGTGGNFRLYGKIIGNRINVDTYDTHD